MNSKTVQFSSFFVVSSFVVALLTTNIASAAPIHVGADFVSCVEGMKARDSKGDSIFSNQQIKDYARDRIAKREAKLNEIDKLLTPTRNNYNYYNSKIPAVQTSIDAINAKRVESLGGIAHDPASDFTFASVPARTLDMGYFESVYANARSVIATARAESAAAVPANNTNRYGFMHAACSVVWGAQVYNTVLPVAKRSYILSRVDVLNLMNSGLNVSRQQAIAGVYKDKKASDPTFDSDGAISGGAGFTANPLAEQGALASVAQQAGGDAVALNDQLNELADTILSYNDDGDLSETLSAVLSTPAVKKKQ